MPQKILILCMLLLGQNLFALNATAIQWKNFDKGMQEANGSKKYTFVSVYTDWCGYCRKLEETTFKAKPVIGELGKNFVSIKLNAESDEMVHWQGQSISARELVGRWGVTGFPTMLFLNSKGDIIGTFPSYAEADLMVKLLTYISSGAREKNISFEDFINKA